jgi:phage-related protein
MGSTRDELAAFPVAARARAGHELFMVLHAFQKTTQKTARPDLEIAMQCYRIARELAEGVKRD